MRKILFLFFALFFSFCLAINFVLAVDFGAQNLEYSSKADETVIKGNLVGHEGKTGKVYAEFSKGSPRFKVYLFSLPFKANNFLAVVSKFSIPTSPEKYNLELILDEGKLIGGSGLPKIVWHGYKFLASNQTEAEYELQNVDKANIIFECASSKDDLENSTVSGKYFAQSYPDIKSNIKSKAICKVSKNTNGEVFSRLCAAANAVTYCTETKVLK